jgi:hypothetical protein
LEYWGHVGRVEGGVGNRLTLQNIFHICLAHLFLAGNAVAVIMFLVSRGLKTAPSRSCRTRHSLKNSNQDYYAHATYSEKRCSHKYFEKCYCFGQALQICKKRKLLLLLRFFSNNSGGVWYIKGIRACSNFSDNFVIKIKFLRFLLYLLIATLIFRYNA